MKTLRILTLFFVCLGISGVATAQHAVAYGNNPEAGRYIVLNGVRHYYEAYGSGRPMLLIHGNSTATKGWAAQIEYFSRRYRVYSIDCRGRGKTEPGKDSLTFTQMAADMAVLIRELHLDSVDVIGKSDGAIVALLMGIHHPAGIRRIVSWAGNASADSNALFPQLLQQITADRMEAERMLARRDTTKNWLVEVQRNRLDEFQPQITAAALQKIPVPVLVMSSDRDVIKLQHTIWIFQNIPLSNLCILPGETHHVIRQNPKLFNTVVDDYLSKPFLPEAARFAH